MTNLELDEKMLLLRLSLEAKIGKPLTEKQWCALYYRAYEAGHAYGNGEIYAQAQELEDLAVALLC